MTWFALLESNTTGTGRQFAAAARARGLRPVLLTRDPARYPYVADDGLDTRVLDTGDADQILATCRGLARDGGLAGVTSSSEYYVAPAARVAAELGLPAPDADAVARCRDKSLQRRVLSAAGVAVPCFRTVKTAAEAVAAAVELGLPVVLKPITGSGSVGVRLCADSTEVARWAARLVGDDGSPILVETAIRGPEFSVETFDGVVRAVVGKRLGPEPWFVEVGHDVPAPVEEAVRDQLGATARRALAALGLGWGAAHTELRLGPAGPVVIEVNPRLAGGMIPAAVRAATGLDLVDAVIARASGGPSPATAPAAGHAAIRFQLLAREGRVAAVRGRAQAAASPGVVVANALTVPGAVVRRTNSFLDRLACVVAQGHDAAAAQRNAERAAPLFSIDIQATEDVHEGGRGR
uniref:Diaminobutyric acid synthase C n=1 Tax=uncultured soil bacterium TaxID=164851 RepID=E2D2N4_9BACT|nr:diaminobutyric acid synthase C [uncultured soil bacterium]